MNTAPAAATGSILGISASAVLQLVAMEGKSCTLTLESQGRVGTISVVEGDLREASAGAFANEDAVCEMLAWEHVTIRIDDVDPSAEKHIKASLMFLLMEAHRLQDEKLREPDEPQAGPPSRSNVIGFPLARAGAEAPQPARGAQRPDEAAGELPKPEEGPGQDTPLIDYVLDGEEPLLGEGFDAPAAPSAADPSGLAARLDQVEGAVGCAVYCPNGTLALSNLSGGPAAHPPATCLSEAEELGRELGAGGRPALLFAGDPKRHYALVRLPDWDAVVEILPGSLVANALRSLRAL